MVTPARVSGSAATDFTMCSVHQAAQAQRRGSCCTSLLTEGSPEFSVSKVIDCRISADSMCQLLGVDSAESATAPQEARRLVFLPSSTSRTAPSASHEVTQIRQIASNRVAGSGRRKMSRLVSVMAAENRCSRKIFFWAPDQKNHPNAVAKRPTLRVRPGRSSDSSRAPTTRRQSRRASSKLAGALTGRPARAFRETAKPLSADV